MFSIEWLTGDEDHIARHDVTREEVEQVVVSDNFITANTPHPMRTMVIGYTTKGRMLSIVLHQIGEQTWNLKTARDASKTELKDYLMRRLEG
jgi:uncharacterized DUF497 family protein